MESLNTSSGTRAARIDPRRSRVHLRRAFRHTAHPGSSTDDDYVIVDTAIAHFDLLIPLHPVFIGSSGPPSGGHLEWLDRSGTRSPRGRQSPLQRLFAVSDDI